MIPLLDVNALVALAWPNHVFHKAAREWFSSVHQAGWATCPITQSGFVRVSSNPRVIPEARSPAEAIGVLRAFTNLDGHEFWKDEIAITDPRHVDPNRLMGHRQVTDAHVLALAILHGGCLATFDRGVRDLAPSGTDERVMVLA